LAIEEHNNPTEWLLPLKGHCNGQACAASDLLSLLHPSCADEGICSLLLSAVAAGRNTVEREGISVSHP